MLHWEYTLDLLTYRTAGPGTTRTLGPGPAPGTDVCPFHGPAPAHTRGTRGKSCCQIWSATYVESPINTFYDLELVVGAPNFSMLLFGGNQSAEQAGQVHSRCYYWLYLVPGSL